MIEIIRRTIGNGVRAGDLSGLPFRLPGMPMDRALWFTHEFYGPGADTESKGPQA